jgi:urease accessory protein
MSARSLLALLHLCDSLFPIGGYAHSDGLEAAAASGAVADAATFRQWMDTLLHESLAYVDGPAVLLAWEGVAERRWRELRALDDEVYAQRPSSTMRTASRAVGTRLLRTWGRLHPHPSIDAMLSTGGPDRAEGADRRLGSWTLTVAFGAVCASAGIARGDALEGFMYTRLAAAASAAMRLMPLGQLEAHAIVAEALAVVPMVGRDVMARRDRPSSFTPLLDLAAMGQQYVPSRLFRS